MELFDSAISKLTIRVQGWINDLEDRLKQWVHGQMEQARIDLKREIGLMLVDSAAAEEKRLQDQKPA